MKFEKELLNRIPAYREEGVLDAANAARLEAHTKNRLNGESNMFRDVLYGIGAIMLCFALILTVAYNWDDFSKNTRIIFSFIPLVVSWFFGSFVLYKNYGAILRESSAILNIAAVLCMIALISQIFQIKGDLRAFMLLVALLSMPALYIFRSSLAAITLCIFAAIYSCYFEWGSNYTQNPYASIILFALILPYCAYGYKNANLLKLVSVFMFCALITASLPICVNISNYDYGNFSFMIFIGMGAILCLASQTKYFNNAPKIPILAFGFIAFIIASSVMNSGFPWGKNIMEAWHLPADPIFAVIAAVWIILFIAAVTNKHRNAAVLIMALVFPVSILAYIGFLRDATQVMLASNMVMFSAGFVLFLIGFKRQHIAIMNIGIGIIVYLAILKFTSDNLSMLFRASLLSGAGIFLIASNFMLNKIRRLNEN